MWCRWEYRKVTRNGLVVLLDIALRYFTSRINWVNKTTSKKEIIKIICDSVNHTRSPKEDHLRVPDWARRDNNVTNGDRAERVASGVKWHWRYLVSSSEGHAVTQLVKVAGSIPYRLTGIFHWPQPSSRSMDLGSTHPLTKISIRLFPGSKWRQVSGADNLATFMCRLSLNLESWNSWSPRAIKGSLYFTYSEVVS